MKRITDRTFKYVSSYETDIGKRFRRLIRENEARAKAQAAADAEAKEKVAVLKRKERT